jgi:hypothetical protein
VTRLVSFSIGGNDVGFADVLASCVVGLFNSSSPGCAQREDAAVKQAMGWLTEGRPAGCHSLPGIDSKTNRPRRVCSNTRIPSLHETYEAAARKLAPNGKVLVVGYPQFFGGRFALVTPIKRRPFNGCKVGTAAGGSQYGITSGDARWINSQGNLLNNTIAAEVTRAWGDLQRSRPDVTIAFVSVDEAFEDHRLCDSSTSWIRGLEFNTGSLLTDPVKQVSFHPSDAGQQAMGRVVRRRI